MDLERRTPAEQWLSYIEYAAQKVRAAHGPHIRGNQAAEDQAEHLAGELVDLLPRELAGGLVYLLRDKMMALIAVDCLLDEVADGSYVATAKAADVVAREIRAQGQVPAAMRRLLWEAIILEAREVPSERVGATA